MKVAERQAKQRISKAEEQRRAETFYHAFKRSNDVMFYTDRNGIILDVNDAFSKHYGWTRAEAIGKTPALLRSRHTTVEFYQRMWSAILDPKKGSWRGEIINRTKDGREVPDTWNAIYHFEKHDRTATFEGCMNSGCLRPAPEFRGKDACLRFDDIAHNVTTFAVAVVFYIH